MVTIMDVICTDITRLTTGLICLKDNVDALYYCLRVLASHLINPLIIPPDELGNILIQVKQDMKTNPRSGLLDNPHNNIQAYYSVMKITPIVIDDFRLLILIIPLPDKSLQMNFNKILTLPTLHLTLKFKFCSILEGPDLAVSNHSMHAALPTDHDIHIYMATLGYICTMNQALYAFECTE